MQKKKAVQPFVMPPRDKLIEIAYQLEIPVNSKTDQEICENILTKCEAYINATAIRNGLSDNQDITKSVGNECTLRAIETYDSHHENTIIFKNFLINILKLAFRSARRDSQPVPRHSQDNIKLYKAAMAQENLNNPFINAELLSCEEAANIMNKYIIDGTLPTKESQRLFGPDDIIKIRSDMLFVSPLSSDLESKLEGARKPIRLSDTFKSKQISIQAAMEDEEHQGALWSVINEALPLLSKNEQNIIRFFYSDPSVWELKPDGDFIRRDPPNPDGKTPEHEFIAQIFGITQSRVRQIRDNALDRIKRYNVMCKEVLPTLDYIITDKPIPNLSEPEKNIISLRMADARGLIEIKRSFDTAPPLEPYQVALIKLACLGMGSNEIATVSGANRKNYSVSLLDYTRGILQVNTTEELYIKARELGIINKPTILKSMEPGVKKEPSPISPEGIRAARADSSSNRMR
jgi:DNA-directed RNA polymerase specialized sigma subunit